MRWLLMGVLFATAMQVSFSASAQSANNASSDGKVHNADLDALAALPKPKQRTDLDTYKLASAHRERAETMQEKTDGLWQSWIVSICEGCGPQMLSYKQRALDAGMKREAATSERPASAEVRSRPVIVQRPTRPKIARIYADLSAEGLDRIRRRTRE